MASQTPSTPVKVPASAANYTPATLDTDLRSQINSLLLKEGHVTKIQDQLLHSLHAHHSNWPTTVQAHAVALLRSGEVTTFPALLRRVIEDVRQETTLAPQAVPPPTPAAKSANGASEVNGKKSANGTPSLEGPSNGNTALPSLAVPQSVVEDALKVTRDCLEMGLSPEVSIAELAAAATATAIATATANTTSPPKDDDGRPTLAGHNQKERDRRGSSATIPDEEPM